MSDKTQLSTEYTSEKRDRKKIIAIILAIVIVLASAAVGLGYTFSRYANTLGDDYHYIDAADFYFSAEYLTTYTTDGNIPTYTVYNYPANNSISFNVCNYADDLSITKEDIKFTANSDNGGDVKGAGTIDGGGAKNSKPVTLTVNDVGIYTVTVSSTSPYEQTLKAKFNFVAAAAPVVTTKFTNYDDYVTLDVAVAPHAQATCSVEVNWDTNNLVLDTNDALFSGKNISKSNNNAAVTVNMNTGGSYSIIFYKKTPGATIPESAVSAVSVNS